MSNGSDNSDSSTSPTEDGDDADGDTTRNIYIDVPEWQWEKLNKTKKTHGLTWKGMLLYARRHLHEKTKCNDE